MQLGVQFRHFIGECLHVGVEQDGDEEQHDDDREHEHPVGGDGMAVALLEPFGGRADEQEQQNGHNERLDDRLEMDQRQHRDEQDDRDVRYGAQLQTAEASLS